MTTAPTRERAQRARHSTFHPVLTAAALLLLCLPGGASAAAVSGNYEAGRLQYANGTTMQGCRGWSGDADAAGREYTACHASRDTDGDGRGDTRVPALLEFTKGTLTRVGFLPAAYNFDDKYLIRDVAVSPDGNTAYVSVGPIIDNLGAYPQNDVSGRPRPGGATAGSILRLTREGNSWEYDPSWKAGPFKLGGNYWAARNLDVDDAGRIYVSVNQYVYQLSPRSGGLISYFGGSTTDGPGGQWIDGIDVAQGVAVAADGNSIYVVEQKHHIVQRWERVGATEWARDRDFLLGRPGEEGDQYCDTNDHFQSPYDVGVDSQGDVYVMDVTCNRIQRFSSRGTFQETVWSDLGSDRVHGFAVSPSGTVSIPTRGVRLVRTKNGNGNGTGINGGPDEPEACTDREAPRITDLDLPNRTSSRVVTVTVSTTDDCPRELTTRISGDRVGSAAWDDSSQRVTLAGGSGAKRLVISVRDSSNRVTTRVAYTTLVLRQERVRVRARVALAGQGCRAGNPLDFVGNASAYRVVDRCARIAGRVTRVKRARGGYMAELLLPAATARAIYTGATGPRRFWIVTDSRTRHGSSVRVGDRAVVVATIIAERGLRNAFAMPVDLLRRG